MSFEPSGHPSGGRVSRPAKRTEGRHTLRGFYPSSRPVLGKTEGFAFSTRPVTRPIPSTAVQSNSLGHRAEVTTITKLHGYMGYTGCRGLMLEFRWDWCGLVRTGNDKVIDKVCG